jgi:hypothetical protein
MAARTGQGNPRQVLAAFVYKARYRGGMSDRAAAEGVAVGDNRAWAGVGNVVSIIPPTAAASVTARLTIARTPVFSQPEKLARPKLVLCQ